MKKLLILHSIKQFNRYSSIINNFLEDSSIKILAFTIEIRLFLQIKNVPYIIPEQFISDEEAEKVEEVALFITKNWHKDFFRFFDISLGLILYREFFYYFMRILKNLHIFLNLLELEKPSEIIIIYEDYEYIREINYILNLVCSIKKIPLNVIKKNDIKNLEKIKNRKLLVKSIIEKIGSSKAYHIFVKSLLKFITFINEIKIRIFNKNKKKILIYDYHYHNIIIDKLLKHSNYNLVLFEDKQDIIKNLKFIKFFRINKKLSYKFIQSFKTYKIRKTQNLMATHYIQIWKNKIKESEFQQQFYYNNISYWPVVKNRIYYTIVKDFKDIIGFILTAFKIFSSNKYNLLILHADARIRHRILTFVANKMNIPSLVIQHGITGHHTTFVPSYATKLAVWGDISKDFLVKYGMPLNQIYITGAPRFDEYIYLKQNEYKQKRKKIKVYNNFGIDLDKNLYVFATVHNHFYSIGSAFDLNNLEIEKYFKMTIKAMKNLPDSHLIIKLHRGDTHEDIPESIKETFNVKNVSIIKDYDIKDLIIACDCFITNYSTTILEAMLCNKPVLLIDFRKIEQVIPLEKYNLFDRISNYKALLEKMKNIRDSPVPVEKYLIFLKDYLYKIDGLSTNRVLNLIDDLIISKVKE